MRSMSSVIRVGSSMGRLLRQGRHQRLLAALILLENLRAETPAPILGHAQDQRPHPRDQPTSIIPAPISLPIIGALVVVLWLLRRRRKKKKQ